MKHIAPGNADGMTLLISFSAFLFIVVWLSRLPLAGVWKREALLAIWKHILSRTMALLIIGVLMVNSETISAKAVNLISGIFSYTGVILSKFHHKTLKSVICFKRFALVGIVILLLCALLIEDP
jgi:hypothetical protein